jgi:hypothetical protein
VEEGLQVLGDDLMEHGVLGVAGPGAGDVNEVRGVKVAF